MATEGVFPKADGDILYGSEVNRFREKLIGTLGEAGGIVWSSGTAVETVGSIYYSGTHPSLFCDHLNINASVYFNNPANSPTANIRFSGTLFNQNMAYSCRPASDTHLPVFATVSSGTFKSWNGNFGSPFFIYVQCKNAADDNYLEYCRVTGV